MKQNEEQKTLTLTLPFLDFKDTDVNIDSKDSYKESGIYFVRNNVGEYLIASAVKENQDAWIWPLPAGVQENFVKQTMKKEQDDRFELLLQKLSDIHNEISARLDEQYSHIRTNINDICYITKRIKENSDILEAIEKRLPSNDSNPDRPSGGYVDQDVLLQIIKEVKR